MSIVFPATKWIPSPNFTPVNINHDLFILHDQEGHTDASVPWLCNPQAQASAHLCLSDDLKTLIQLVPLYAKAWAQCAFNSRGISLEMPGFADKGFSDDLLRTSALIAAWCCLSYSIPVQWAQGGVGRGLCCHHDLGAAGGGHHDVGPIGGPTWQRFMQFVSSAFDELKKLPSLPLIALHGAPGPHLVSPTPDVQGVPSHGGAPRCEPGDVIAHATPSTYVEHSIAAMQFDLNKVLGSKLQGVVKNGVLDVDGWFGADSKAALRLFQRLNGINDDGLIGPESWGMLSRCMTEIARC